MPHQPHCRTIIADPRPSPDGYAATKEKAAEKVLLRLTKEFTTGVSAAIWNSDAPKMTVEDGWRIGIHQLRSAPNRGSTFYEP
jgi:hypothetical protein